MSRILRGGPRPSDVVAPTAPGARIVPSAVFDGRAEAARIVAAARAEAAEIVETARLDARNSARDAEREGRVEGRAEAAAALAEALAIRDRALADAEREVARVALVAAERLVGEAIVADPARLATIVGDGLARARRARDVVVRVHPDDAPHVESLRSAIAARAGRPATFSVRPDADLTRGSCLVETDLGTIDARLETKLDALARALGVER
jgi:type III secretion system HrpE/YscL family protein